MPAIVVFLFCFVISDGLTLSPWLDCIGLNLLSSSDRPTSAFLVAGTIGERCNSHSAYTHSIDLVNPAT